MKKLIIVYVVLIIVVILLVIARNGGNFLSFLPSFGGGSSATAEVGGKKINLLVAKDEPSRQRGLSGRDKLDPNQGMIFVFDRKDKYGFWMKDMKFPIDIIFIDDNKVVDIIEKAPSGGQTENLTIYRPETPANYVLELNAGESEKLKIKKGTTIKLNGI